MEFVAEPLDDLGDSAVVVGVFLAAAGRLRQPLGEFGLHRFGIRLGAGVQRGGIAGRVTAQTGYGTTQRANQLVKEVAQSRPMRFLPEGVQEAGHPRARTASVGSGTD